MAARESPQFGVRLLAELSPAARAEVVRRWSEAQPLPAPAKPGLRKCAAPASPADTSGLGAQLQAFSRSIGRVG